MKTYTLLTNPELGLKRTIDVWDFDEYEETHPDSDVCADNLISFTEVDCIGAWEVHVHKTQYSWYRNHRDSPRSEIVLKSCDDSDYRYVIDGATPVEVSAFITQYL